MFVLVKCMKILFSFHYKNMISINKKWLNKRYIIFHEDTILAHLLIKITIYYYSYHFTNARSVRTSNWKKRDPNRNLFRLIFVSWIRIYFYIEDGCTFLDSIGVGIKEEEEISRLKNAEFIFKTSHEIHINGEFEIYVMRENIYLEIDTTSPKKS